MNESGLGISMCNFQNFECSSFRREFNVFDITLAHQSLIGNLTSHHLHSPTTTITDRLTLVHETEKKLTQIGINLEKEIVPGKMSTANHSSCLLLSVHRRNEFGSACCRSVLCLVQETLLF